jgi:hypothetical protein
MTEPVDHALVREDAVGRNQICDQGGTWRSGPCFGHGLSFRSILDWHTRIYQAAVDIVTCRAM